MSVTSYVAGLRCHVCKTVFPARALWVCDQCLGPLEVTYDYAAIAGRLTREVQVLRKAG
jgi:threonine synthase